MLRIRIIRRVGAVLGLLAFLGLLLAAGGGQVTAEKWPAPPTTTTLSFELIASNGDHDQEFTCTTPDTAGGAGTTFTSVYSYHITGVGTSADNKLWSDQWAFHTTPAALMDYVGLSFGQLAIKNYGGSISTQNDVSSSFSSTNLITGHGWLEGSTPPLVNITIYGGVSNGDGHCTKSRALL